MFNSRPERLEILRASEGQQLIAEIAQPLLQAIIDIENSGLSAHRIISDLTQR